MSPPGCPKMWVKPCNRNAEESFPVLSLKSREQKPPNPLLIQDKDVLQPSLGLNAAARTFDKAKNTILAWERKFVDLHRVLLLSTLVHAFLAVVIEGDEAYTKVHQNVPPDQSLGWTILLMERASRFIWA